MMCMLLDDISVSDRRESNRQALQLVLYNLAQRAQNKTFSTVLAVLCYVLSEIHMSPIGYLSYPLSIGLPFIGSFGSLVIGLFYENILRIQVFF